jgi:hypothetical protein
MTQCLRTSRTPARIALPLLLALAGPLRAQQLIGYVNTRDADITGASDVLNGQAVLTGSVSVTAKDHTAPIALGRGGTVRVCQTSVLHLTESRAVAIAAPLLFSLDRGAIEIQMMGTASDAIMTPDMRFTVRNSGPLDLRLRVARNGDTCVENRGSSAPTLAVSDPFGESMYEVPAGRHILFEHGSLHEVVDNESSPCGCPDAAKGMSVADVLLASGGPKPAASAPTPAPPPAAPPVVVSVVVPVAPPATVAAVVPASAQAPLTAAPVAPPVVVPAAPPVVVSTVVPVAEPPASAPASLPVVQSAPPAAPPLPDAAADLAAQQSLQAAEQTASQAAIRAAEQTATQTPAQAAEQHPFPVAISEGLAPVAEVPQAVPGQVHAQISDTLSYNAPAKSPASAPAGITPAPSAAASRGKKARAAKPAAPAPAAPAPAPAAPAPSQSTPAPPPPAHDLAHVVGRFFKRLFGHG